MLGLAGQHRRRQHLVDRRQPGRDHQPAQDGRGGGVLRRVEQVHQRLGQRRRAQRQRQPQAADRQQHAGQPGAEARRIAGVQAGQCRQQHDRDHRRQHQRGVVQARGHGVHRHVGRAADAVQHQRVGARDDAGQHRDAEIDGHLRQVAPEDRARQQSHARPRQPPGAQVGRRQPDAQQQEHRHHAGQSAPQRDHRERQRQPQHGLGALAAGDGGHLLAAHQHRLGDQDPRADEHRRAEQREGQRQRRPVRQRAPGRDAQAERCAHGQRDRQRIAQLLRQRLGLRGRPPLQRHRQAEQRQPLGHVEQVHQQRVAAQRAHVERVRQRPEQAEVDRGHDQPRAQRRAEPGQQPRAHLGRPGPARAAVAAGRAGALRLRGRVLRPQAHTSASSGGGWPRKRFGLALAP